MSVTVEIQEEIHRNGPITFARFMEIALYSQDGYYNKKREVGKKGDFYTSVSVGPLFGELLARQFAKWLRESNINQIIEIGAHDGSLARDVLTWLSTNAQDLYADISYVVIDSSPHRRSWQQQTLASHKDRVSWQNELQPLTRAIVFSNELLDAMPVHRLRWNANHRKWDEWFVDCENGKLILSSSNISVDAQRFAPKIPQDLAEVLPDGFTTEVSPAAINWWTDTATKLEQGKLIAIDYGLTEQEFFRPDRANGTARAYFKHHLADDLLANPGEQDLTAHVNWTAVQRAGEQPGLKTETFCSQEEFLMRIVRQVAAENWNADQIRQLKTLTHPNFLGRAFRVLVQSRVDRH